MSPSTLRLYTVQPTSMVRTLLQEGRLLAKPEFGEEDTPWDWRSAYTWLAQQMRTRLFVAAPATAEFPFWAWHFWNGAVQPKPDLRYSSMRRWAKSTERHVLLEMAVPADGVLLSDYDAWHWVLNYWYLGAARETCRFERDLKAKGLCFWKQKPLPDEAEHIRMAKSWERIFDFAAARLVGMPPKNQRIQATFWSLRADELCSAVEFGGDLPRSRKLPVGRLAEALG